MKTIFLAALLLAALSASAQETPDAALVTKGISAKFAAVPGVPDCATLAVLKGDPGKGPSVVEMKFTPGCVIPWHWHTPSESAVPLAGLLEISMKGEKPALLANGDYGYLPSKHIHQAKCTGSRPCAAIFFLDAPFDIHYVDKSGTEIPAAQALAEAEKLMTKPGTKPAVKP
ncbi:MAG TPA: cupin domain-containing protein [Candidatus Limnocylindrales bacterium]|nr:cupin domain-containing protein [Candidatus Limnocylindrales bacterium]